MSEWMRLKCFLVHKDFSTELIFFACGVFRRQIVAGYFGRKIKANGRLVWGHEKLFVLSQDQCLFNLLADRAFKLTRKCPQNLAGYKNGIKCSSAEGSKNESVQSFFLSASSLSFAFDIDSSTFKASGLNRALII